MYVASIMLQISYSKLIKERPNPSGCCMLHKVRDAALFLISIQCVKMTTDSSPGG